jgi:membrane protein required for beta-lactamase induction
MQLIIILATLAMDRFTKISEIVRNYHWFSTYLGKIQQYLGKTVLWRDGLPVACWVVPILLVTLILQCIFHHVLHGVLGYLFSFVVLVYCLGPANFKAVFASYLESKDSAERLKAVKELGLIKSHGRQPENLPQFIAKHILTLANSNLFAMLFWYLLLGAFGVVLYKSFSLLAAESESDSSLATPYQSMINTCLSLLDWIPVRVTALIYALAGSFPGCFGVWWSQLLTGPENNQAFLAKCGLGALHVVEDESPEGLELSTISLVDRSLVIVLAFIAIVTLTAWFY